ncbi:class I SAM-dependent methyltransferase [Paenibacillus sinopodophylli]|uniref:class I SAM-dependent methyltransferase n=1 Tax=Paenibacillus sinopodophylli TaxID=1837342 RepID=UPI0014873D2D|nr:class I SAM-dependent methyltransferase [Paenibacillus sinopodophylli]
MQYPDEEVVSFFNRNKGKFQKGIDIACGAGRHTFLMASHGIEAVGVDSSTSSIEYAKATAADKQITNVSFECKLAQELSFPDQTFDVVVVWGLIHYLDLEAQQSTLKEAYRILKDGGQLLCTLRSEQDTRAKEGIETEPNRYSVEYFDAGSSDPKKTLMYFWDEAAVRAKLSDFQSIELGHRVIEPIGKLGNKTAHWLISATK